MVHFLKIPNTFYTKKINTYLFCTLKVKRQSLQDQTRFKKINIKNTNLVFYGLSFKCQLILQVNAVNNLEADSSCSDYVMRKNLIRKQCLDNAYNNSVEP